MRILSSVVFLLSLLSSGCVGVRHYRYLPGQQPPKGQRRLEAIEDKGKYKLAFVEFDDDGKPIDTKQQDAAIELIGKERTGPDGALLPSVLMIYIHGWKNNADQAPAGQFKDVEKFSAALERVSSEVNSPDGPRIPVIGAYIAWRGKSLNLPSALSWVSFWTRSAAARRIGGEGDVRKTIERLIDAGHRGRGDMAIKPRVFLLGHSFGGRLLDYAMTGKDRSSVTGSCVALAAGKPVTSPVDLVLFVNSATGSRDMRRLIRSCPQKPPAILRAPDFDRKVCSEHPDQGRCEPFPLVMGVSSKTDLLTKFVLLVASTLVFQPQLPAAHNAALQTHTVQEVAAQAPAPPGTVFSFESARGGPRRWAVTAKGSPPDHPVWLMDVEKYIIDGHGDVWNEDFLSMMLGLVGHSQLLELKSFDKKANTMRMMK